MIDAATNSDPFYELIPVPEEDAPDYDVSGSLYDILGVPRHASKKAIRASFKRLSKLYHPDIRATGDADTFLAISRAYQVLIDPELRKQYDLRMLETDDTADPIFINAKRLLKESLRQLFATDYDLTMRNLPDDLKRVFGHILKPHLENKTYLEEELLTLRGVLKRMRVKRGKKPENLLAKVINEKIDPVQATLEDTELEIDSIKLILRELDNIEQVMDLAMALDAFDDSGEPPHRSPGFKPTTKDQWRKAMPWYVPDEDEAGDEGNSLFPKDKDPDDDE